MDLTNPANYQRLTIPHKLPTLNEYIASNRSDRQWGMAIKKRVTLEIAQLASLHLKPVTTRCAIHYVWYLTNKRKDPDNVRFAAKFINDGLVLARILKNDSLHEISALSDEWVVDKLGTEKVVVFLQETG